MKKMSATVSSSFLSLCIVLVSQCIFSEGKATRYPQGVKPPQFEFDVFNIKTPQMIGIIFGVLVFSLTIMSVVMLLYKSGSLSRFQSEIQSGAPLKVNLGSKTSVTPQTSTQPELYDHLIAATQALPRILSIPPFKGKLIELRQYNESSDLSHLYEASNGEARFHESAYDPQRIWGWLPNFAETNPSQDRATLGKCLQQPPTAAAVGEEEGAHSTHLVIIDPTLKKAVGMLSLVNNSTKNLTIQIDNLWLTPAYQGVKFSHEAMMLTLDYLVQLGYRRVTAEVDTRHLIARKFLERCGFKIEGILRKHRIVNKKNRDSVLFVFLNSDWLEVSTNLKKLLGIDLKPKTKKIADVDKPDNLFVNKNSNGIVRNNDKNSDDNNGDKNVTETENNTKKKAKKNKKKNKPKN